MISVKRQVAQILDQLPDDCTLEDVQYQLYVVETIRRRMEMADRGSLVPQTAAEQRLDRWLIK